ncbi:hypothetical protein VSR34_34415 [Paraburkholderia sp. JHI2823]|uniref:hypothetical protein n=1 Tax=Paraburkholderia sp. JHI2823 TaxID=3112960 RepID=UPI0031758D14
MNYSGIDLHSNNSVVTVTDETDLVLAEKRLPNEWPKILAFLAPWRAELAGVVVESTFYGRHGIMHGLSKVPRRATLLLRTPVSASPSIDFP